MSNFKTYRVEVGSDNDYHDIPALVEFAIDELMAKEIIRLAALVKEYDLYKVEKFAGRANFLRYDPDNDPESALALGEDNDVRTEIDVLNVSNTEFWFSAYLKHADVEIWSERQRIDELAQHFGLLSLRTGADHEVL